MMDADALLRDGLAVLSRAGLGERALSLYDDLLGIPHLEHLDTVDEAITDFTVAPAEKRGAVLVPMVPGSFANNYLHCIIAHAFETRGYEAITPTCGECLPLCPYLVGDSAGYERDLCRVSGPRTVETFGFEGTTLADLLPETYRPPAVEEGSHDIEHREVPVAEFAEASTRKYLRRYRVDFADEDIERLYRRYLQSGIILTDAYERVFATEDVAAVFSYEDHYVHGGVPLALATKHGIPGYSIELGYRDGTLVFGKSTNRNTQPRYTDHAVVARAVDEPLTDAQREEIDRLMAQRTTGEQSVYNYSAKTSVSVENDAATTVGLFTNLPWDASLEIGATDIAFTDVFEWIETTVETLGGHEGVALVVKTHPAELVHGTNESVHDWLTNRSLPANVTVLAPDTEVNTYELLDDIDAGIVYSSTVGLEAAYRGLPVVVAGDTHYRDLGFTIDPSSAAAYHDVLADIEDVSAGPAVRERARRYAHFLFVRKHVRFPFYSIDPTAASESLELRPVRHEDVRPGNENFDRLVERAVAGEPIIGERTDPPEPTDETAARTVE